MQIPTDSINLNPSEEVMAGEAMPQTLAAQASVLWPQERQLIERYRLPTEPRILDAGCGTGEASERLANLFPSAHILGVDVLESLLTIARRRFQNSKCDVTFWKDSIYELQSPPRNFDLTVCRHVLQAIPQFVPSHVAVPLAGTEHAVHEPPHDATAPLLTHAPEQTW